MAPSKRNFGRPDETLEVVTKLEVIQHGGPLRSVSLDLGSVISRQQDWRIQPFCRSKELQTSTARFLQPAAPPSVVLLKFVNS
jgi:hypothetical protein